MIASLILLLAASEDPVVFSLPPANRLTPMCLSATCTPAARRPSYRIEDDGPDPRISAKDRAFANDGSYCSVVGAKRCTKKQRTIFRTDFTG